MEDLVSNGNGQDEKTEEMQHPSDVVSLGEFSKDRNRRTPVDGQSQTGGFSTHLRADLARMAVIYLEQDDPKRKHREKVVCTVNLGDFELRYPSSPDAPEKMSDDGRTLRRKMWDDAVRALVGVVADSGLNPKFVKNDKNSCRLTLKQEDILNADQAPDEFFTMELYYCSEFELEKRKLDHIRRIDKFGEDIRDCNAKIFDWRTSKLKKKELSERIAYLEREKQFFIATTPDPREMDSGLIFKCEMFTLKEYGVVKEKLRAIMSSYLEEMSKIASRNGTTLDSGDAIHRKSA